jgi:hypothetical protein
MRMEQNTVRLGRPSLLVPQARPSPMGLAAPSFPARRCFSQDGSHPHRAIGSQGNPFVVNIVQIRGSHRRLMKSRAFGACAGSPPAGSDRPVALSATLADVTKRRVDQLAAAIDAEMRLQAEIPLVALHRHGNSGERSCTVWIELTEPISASRGRVRPLKTKRRDDLGGSL